MTTDTRFATKTAVLLHDDLQPWQALNVTAFVTSGITAANPGLIGEPYADADGTAYLRMLGQPVLILQGNASVLAAAHGRALQRGLTVAVFTAELFATRNDTDNRAAVAAVAGDSLDLVGLGMHGPRGAIDKIVKGAHMHP